MVFLASVRCCDPLVHSVDYAPFVPVMRTNSKLNLPGKGTFVYAGINKGLADTSNLNDLRQEEQVRGSTKKKYAGWPFVQTNLETQCLQGFLIFIFSFDWI